MFKILISQKCKWTWVCWIRIREETESWIRSKASQTLRWYESLWEFMKQIQLWHKALSTTIRAGWGWKWRKIRSPQIRMKEMACRVWNLPKAVGSATNLRKVSGPWLTSNSGTAPILLRESLLRVPLWTTGAGKTEGKIPSNILAPVRTEIALLFK